MNPLVNYGTGRIAGGYYECTARMGECQRWHPKAELDSTKELTANANTINIGTGMMEVMRQWFAFNLGTASIDSLIANLVIQVGPPTLQLHLYGDIQSGEPTWIGGHT